MSDSGAAARAAAARAVHDVALRGRSLDAALADAEARLPAADRSLLRALTYGVLRYYWRLDAQTGALLDRPLRARDRVIGALLAVGCYQLGDMRVANHAAVSLTVEAARILGRPKLAGLVNAVLRRFLREPAALDTGIESVRYDHPAWMIERLRDDWPGAWQEILAANNRRAPMWLRVNARRTTAAAYLERLSGGGSLAAGLDQAVRLESPCAVDDLPGFADGDVSVQDGAAQLAAPWLLAGGGRRLLDMCAAPGGKAAHLLELSGPDTTLMAVDPDAGRAERIRGTLGRLGFEATICIADAADLEAWWDGSAFDAVLLDVPCSGTGVIRRHPDIKHLRRPGDIAGLAALQQRLLDAGWEVLASGGRLLYATCSVLRAENDDVVQAFVERHPDAVVNNVLPNNNIHDLMERTKHGFQVLPGTQDLDGFFYACLEKRG